VRLLVLAWVLSCVGCSEDGLLLVVDLRTDLAPGDDFERVRTEVQRAGSTDSLARVDVPVDPLLDYVAGGRVAEVADLAPGSYVVEVALVCGGAVVASATESIDLEAAGGVIVAIDGPRGCTADGGPLDGGTTDGGATDGGAADARAGDGGLPDGGPSDAGLGTDHCVSVSDRAALMRADYGSGMSDTFEDVVDAVGRDCVLAGATGEELEQCSRDSIVSGTGGAVSAMCAACYAAGVRCTAEQCISDCLEGSTAAGCVACQCGDNAAMLSCGALVETCSGVPTGVCPDA